MTTKAGVGKENYNWTKELATGKKINLIKEKNYE